LIEQFLASNVNKRTDAYGGTYEKRCTFALELMSELSKAIGEERLAIRLTPFGLFNQIRSEQRLETWQTLCKKLKEAHPGLSYVSFVEPVSWTAFGEMAWFLILTDKHSTAIRTSAQRKGKAELPRLVGSQCH
jgi:2,4-dienoyl-CoA reductase-like NADH-dependent reductase (Old Yellow Enzyme family)